MDSIQPKKTETIINNFPSLKGTPHISENTTVVTDIFIFLDTAWEYNYVMDYVNYIVERLNINAYGSSITLLAARDGSVIVNQTNYITEFYENWNITTHSQHRPGFSLPIILSKARDLAEDILRQEREASSLGGRSMIALLIPSPIAFVHEYDFDYCQEFVNYLNVTQPDLHFIYYTGGAVIRFMYYVDNPPEDLFMLSYDLDVETAAEPVVKRIRKVPRRLSNPRCSRNWYVESWGSNQLMQYEGLGKIIFYRLSPNYFFNEGSMRYLKIIPTSSVAYAVCTSRSNPWPYRNPTSPYTSGEECKQISTTDFSYDLGDLCLGYDNLLDCPPLYLSVQAQTFADASQVSCADPACTSPDETQYSIFVNNLDCSNKGSQVILNFVYIITVFIVFKLF